MFAFFLPKRGFLIIENQNQKINRDGDVMFVDVIAPRNISK